MKPDGLQNKSSTRSHGLILFTVMILFLAGCASHATKASQETPSKSQRFIIAPTNFIRQIASTDRIIVSPISPDPLFKDLRLTLTDKKATDVIKTVSLLKDDSIVGRAPHANCNCEDWKMQFYQGTNCLGEIRFVSDVVDINGEYRDYTGTFEKISNEISDKMETLILQKYP